MKVILLVVGKTTHTYLNTGIDDYKKRIGYYIPFEMICTTDLKNTKSLSQQQQKESEGSLIQKFLEPNDFIVLLDEHGKEFTSINFSKYIESKMATVPKRLVFIVGGPYGFSDEIKNMAREKMSISKMTFPHDLIRLMFVEQLYRAMSIMKNEPYHHE